MSRRGTLAGIGDGLNAIGGKRFGLSLIALVLILAIVFWLRPNVACTVLSSVCTNVSRCFDRNVGSLTSRIPL